MYNVDIIHSPKLKIKNKNKISEIKFKIIGIQKLSDLFKPLLTRKKSVKECTCKTITPREEEEELTMLEPEKVSEKNNGTTDLSLPKENGTDYSIGYWSPDYDVKPRDKCNPKTQSWSVSNAIYCLDKCSKKKKCPTKKTCQKICISEYDFFNSRVEEEASHQPGLSSLKGKQLHKAVCRIRSWVQIGDNCHPKCKKVSDCLKSNLSNQARKDLIDQVRCESICV